MIRMEDGECQIGIGVVPGKIGCMLRVITARFTFEAFLDADDIESMCAELRSVLEEQRRSLSN